MSERPTVNFELAILLPLGVLENQLRKSEADLRFLNARALSYAEQCQVTGAANQLTTRLESINETLDVIRALIADLEATIQPRSDAASRRPDANRED